jgi:hypothetical protein
MYELVHVKFCGRLFKPIMLKVSRLWPNGNNVGRAESQTGTQILGPEHAFPASLAATLPHVEIGQQISHRQDQDGADLTHHAQVSCMVPG